MINLLRTTFLLAIISITNISYSQTKVTPQEFMVGTFKYCNVDGATIVMTKKKAVETIVDARGEVVVVTSKIKWLDENRYQVTFVKVKGKSHIKKGIVVIVYVKEINDDEAEVAFTFSTGQKTGDCFKKLK